MFSTITLVLCGALIQAAGAAMQKHGMATRFPKLGLGEFVSRFGAVMRVLVRNWIWLLGGVLGLVGGLLFLQAFSQADLSVIVPLASMGVLFTTVIGVVFLGEHMSPREGVAAGVIVIGAVLVGMDAAELGRVIPETTTNLVLYAAVAALCAALVLGQHLWPRRIPIELALALAAALQFGVGNVMIKTATGVARQTTGGFNALDPESLAALGATPELWLCILSNVVGFVLIHAAFAHGRIAVIGPVLSGGNTGISVLAGFALLQEPANGPRLVGIGALLLGAALLSVFHQDGAVEGSS